MSLLPLFQWLSQTRVGLIMQQSTWGFAVVEMVHLLALAVLGGIILLVNLGLLGISLRRQPVSRIARELKPLFFGSLAMMLISGVLLLSEEAIKCYYSPAFRAKMLFLVLAILFSCTLHQKVASGSVNRGLLPKGAAVVSLTLWLGVGVAGRFIGFI